MYWFIDQMARILFEECMQMWKKLKSSTKGTSSPKSHHAGFILKGIKRSVEELTLYSPHARA